MSTLQCNDARPLFGIVVTIVTVMIYPLLERFAEFSLLALTNHENSV